MRSLPLQLSPFDTSDINDRDDQSHEDITPFVTTHKGILEEEKAPSDTFKSLTTNNTLKSVDLPLFLQNSNLMPTD